MEIQDIYTTNELSLEICDFIHLPNFLNLTVKKKLQPLFINQNNDLYILNNNLKPGSIIFTDNHYMPSFFKHFEHIHIPFFLVSANSDRSCPYYKSTEKCETILNNPNLIKWFSVNVAINHPKLIPIPIGIPRTIPKIYENGNGIEKYMGWDASVKINDVKNLLVNTISTEVKDFNEIIKQNFLKHKPEFLYSRMTLENSDNPFHDYKEIRRVIIKSLQKNNFALQTDIIPFENYYQELSNYKVCLSLPGAGLDCYRTWESMYLGVVPIVLKTPGMEELFTNLPVILLEYHELEYLTPQRVYEEYITILKKIFTNKINFNKLKLCYWIELIKTTKINYILENFY
jgi:hypothetical protein